MAEREIVGYRYEIRKVPYGRKPVKYREERVRVPIYKETDSPSPAQSASDNPNRISAPYGADVPTRQDEMFKLSWENVGRKRQASLSEGTRLVLQQEDARTDEQRAADQRQEEEAQNLRLFEDTAYNERENTYTAPYKERAYDAAGNLESANQSDPVVRELWTMAHYESTGEVAYSGEDIDREKNDLFYDLYRLGRSEPRASDITAARQKSAAILAASDQSGHKLTKKERQRLENLSSKDTDTVEAEIHDLKDNRRTGRYQNLSGGLTHEQYTYHRERYREDTERLRNQRLPGYVTKRRGTLGLG